MIAPAAIAIAMVRVSVTRSGSRCDCQPVVMSAPHTDPRDVDHQRGEKEHEGKNLRKADDEDRIEEDADHHSAGPDAAE